MKSFIASLAIASSAIAISLSTSDCTVPKPGYLPPWVEGAQTQCPVDVYNKQVEEPLDCDYYDEMYNSVDWDYFAREEYWYIYWNFWDVAWPFASTEHKTNPWKWYSDDNDWYVTWGDIAAVYNTCWE